MDITDDNLQHSSYHTIEKMKFLYLKHTANLGFLYMKQELLDLLLDLLTDSIELIGLQCDDDEEYDEEDNERMLDELSPETGKVTCTLLHNFSVVCQKKGMFEVAVKH